MQQHINKQIQQYYDNWFGINAAYERWAKMHGLNSNLLFTLFIIYNCKENCTQKMICDKLLLPKQTVNTILDQLEKKDLVIKKVSDLDRRNKLIEFTPKGEVYSKKILTQLKEFESKAFQQMDIGVFEQMVITSRAFLEKLNLALETE